MGNAETKENKEYITFESIQNSLGLKDPKMLKIYLTEIFNDLADSTDDQNRKVFSKYIFCNYTKFPIFISYKVFESFSKLSPEGLYEEEFVDNFVKLYMGSFEEILSIIFNILDFNKDGKLIKSDIKLFLSYLTLKGVDDEYDLEINSEKNYNNKTDFTNKFFEIQMKSLEEINNKINKVFKKIPYSMDLTQFTQLITEKNSEIFLQILCFLYDNMPFTAENVDALEMEYEQIKKEKLLINSSENNDSKNSNMIKIKIQKNNTLLSSAEIFFKKFNIKKCSIYTRKSLDNIYCFKKSNDSDNKNTNKNVYNTEKFINTINIASRKINIRNINDHNKIIYENWIYKMTKNGKLKRFYLVLINKDIYYYKSESKNEFDGMHNLTGCYINKLKSEIFLEGKEFFAFEIYSKNKSRQRKFYIDDRNVFKEFTKKIKTAIGYKKLSNYYEKGEVIGEGTFGLINLGMNKKTGQKVAIKMIKKE